MKRQSTFATKQQKEDLANSFASTPSRGLTLPTAGCMPPSPSSHSGAQAWPMDRGHRERCARAAHQVLLKTGFRGNVCEWTVRALQDEQWQGVAGPATGPSVYSFSSPSFPPSLFLSLPGPWTGELKEGRWRGYRSLRKPRGPPDDPVESGNSLNRIYWSVSRVLRGPRLFPFPFRAPHPSFSTGSALSAGA